MTDLRAFHALSVENYKKQLYQREATARNHNEVEQLSVQMPSFLEHSAAKKYYCLAYDF